MDTLSHFARQLGKPMSYFLEEEIVTSPNQNIMASARESHRAGDWQTVLKVLEDYHPRDPLFDEEMGLLRFCALLDGAEAALGEGKRPYALDLLERADKVKTIYRDGRRFALLMAKAGMTTALPDLDEELLLRAELTEDPRRAAALLDAAEKAGLASIGVGKIYDIFAGRGTTEHVYNKSNADGMGHALRYAGQDFTGLCFVNLVDFDMNFGHRRDIDGYANALSEFDAWLPGFMAQLGDEDLVMITADHGCDPAYTATTDHTREYVPLLILGKQVKPVNLGTRDSFADIAATSAELLGISLDTPGKSFAAEIL